MDNLDRITERIHQSLQSQTEARDRALFQARQLTRCSANAIRAIHRGEEDIAAQNLREGCAIVEILEKELADFPYLYYAGYTQDALKEYVEANITVALIQNKPLPSPEELGVFYPTYLQGLAETVGELRRRCLDILRDGYSDDIERLLGCMDDIYDVLVTMDYPDAITRGLRRLTDIVRGITERTRGDLTISLSEQRLEASMRHLEERLEITDPDEK